MSYRFIVLGSWLLVSAPAWAQEHAVAAKIGMLGLGAEYSYALSERLAVRAGLNGSSLGYDATESGIDYAFDLEWDSLSVGVDFHPTRGALRLSAGLLRNNNQLRATSRPTDDVTVGDTTYTPEEVGTLSGVVDFDRSVAPFVSVGWDWSRNKRLGVALDLGVVSQGAPSVALSANGTLLGDPQFAADLQAESAELESSIDSLDMLPFVTLGLVFRF